MGAPWGKLISTTGSLASSIGAQNPYRYRAYRYDTELEMYYLNSRYYDPEIGRFINADDVGLLGANGELISYNLYIYCGNNPIIYIDTFGTSWENINDFFEAFFDSIVLEVGVGYGLDRSYGAGSLGEVSLGAYHDALTIGIKDGKTYTAISGSAGASIEVFEEIELGISTEYEHTFEEGYNSVFDEHTTHSAPWDVYNCPKTIKDPFKFEIGLKETNISDDGFILGTSGSRHTLVGGHYVVGFDIVGFLKRLFS